MSTTDTERTCCPTHRDRCRFGREHFWAGPFLLDGGKPVNGETWSHPDDVRCHVCEGVCSGNRPAPDTERDERLRKALSDISLETVQRGLHSISSRNDDPATRVNAEFGNRAIDALLAEVARLDAVVTAQAAMHDGFIRSLATANGRSDDAERTAWGLPTTTKEDA